MIFLDGPDARLKAPFDFKTFLYLQCKSVNVHHDWLAFVACVHCLSPAPLRTIGIELPNGIDSRGTHGCFAAKSARFVRTIYDIDPRFLWQVKVLPQDVITSIILNFVQRENWWIASRVNPSFISSVNEIYLITFLADKITCVTSFHEIPSAAYMGKKWFRFCLWCNQNAWFI